MTKLSMLFSFSIMLIFCLALAAGCSMFQPNPPVELDEHQIPVENQANTPGEQSAMEENVTQPMTLAEGQSQPLSEESLPTAATQPLKDEEIEAILSRMPTLSPERTGASDFKLAGGLLPPPRTGETVQQPFPPAATAEPIIETIAGPLEVLRFSPEGEIPVAPFISVTFNQPMVPITTLADLAKEAIPITLQPDLPGIWRWIGTKTLTFNYDSKLIDRLPKSTIYTVTIPAGIKSQTGGTLEKAVSWKFTTPTVRLVKKYPENISQPPDPKIFLAFDQRIDPAAVIKTITLTADGKSVPILLSTKTDWQKNNAVSRLAENAGEDRWMVIQPETPLPLASNVQVTIGPDTPSAEGPLKTAETQSFNFHTYSPLKVDEHGCTWGGEICRPLTPLFIRFNNPLDPKTFQEGMLKISPEPTDVTANAVGQVITIQGETRGRTTYTVTLSPDIQDIYGQKLAKNQSLTFKIDPAEKVLTGPNQIFITLDPASGDPTVSVYSINYSKLDVQVFRVEPADWPAYLTYLQNYQRTDKSARLPGKRVFDDTVDIKSTADTLTETGIKLKPYLIEKSGQFIVIVKPHLGLFEKEEYRRTIHVWAQVTRIGLDAMVDQGKMTAWTTDLLDGTPLEGVHISSDGKVIDTKTGEAGLITFDIPSGASYLTAALGDDLSILPRSTHYWGNETWNPSPVTDELRWYVFDDRQIYKPGEEIHIKGWMRRVGGPQTGDVELVGDNVSEINYQVIEPQGNEIGNGRIKVNPLGGFDLAFTIPTGTNLGSAQIILNASGKMSFLSNTSTVHTFQIQEFRRPEFEVTARNETSGPFFAGESGTAVVEAKYYAGGALPNAEVTWQVTSTPGSYNPPNWPDFTFGYWTPWWINRSYSEDGYPDSFAGSSGNMETFSGKTDASGTHYLKINFEKKQDGRPVSISAQATVMDVNRQAWTGSTNMLVHPADLYIGLRSDHYFVEKGTPLQIDFIVTDIDGKAVEDRSVSLQAARLEWKFVEGRWTEVEKDIQKCDQPSRLEPVTCSFETPVGGSYRITAEIRDKKGRLNKTELTRWVSGGKRPPARKVEQEELTLIPDKETYQPGDIARILVQSPFSPADGVMTISRSGILYSEPFHIDEGTITLQVPITEAHIPNLNVQVGVAGSAPRLDDNGEVLKDVPDRPAFATGELNLNIPPLQRELNLTAIPVEPETEPGKETTVQVTLKDNQGNPVRDAEVSVVVVDEAILALSSYSLADPISIFYADRPSGFTSFYSRSNIILADPLALAQDASLMVQEKSIAEDKAFFGGAPMSTSAMMMAAPAMEAPPAPRQAAAQPIRIRSDFNPLAAFSPSVMTDAAGKSSIPVKLPDNLTRYRVMAVAVDNSGRRFGISETNLVARLPLMVRPSAPRFLNFGDRFELPVVLQNQTDADLTTEIAIRASNLQFTADHGYRVIIPARDRVEVRFPANTLSAGTVQFQVAAVSGPFSDAASISLPVYTPATTEDFATYGVLDEGTLFQPVGSPSDVYPQFGSLEISTSSTALQALTDAVIYLVSYPFECSEQLSSRILGVAALRDVLTAFQSKDLPSPEALHEAVQRDITRLQGMQNNDGGLPYWRHGEESIPFNTIHAAHALQRAKLKGFSVPQDMLTSLLTYLQQIESHFPNYYSTRTRQVLTAYALYVRELMGDKDTTRAASLLDEAGMDNLPLDAIGWLWKVMLDSPEQMGKVDAIRNYVGNRVVETAGAANFATTYDDQNYLLLGSNRRTDAILLEALMLDNPQSDLIPKVVNGLLAHRVKGRWSNTQENVFVLLTLDQYFNTYEAQTPEFVAKIWLGETYAGSHQFNGRTTERQETDIPMKVLVEQIPQGESRDLIVSKEGTGRLYYRLGLNYASVSLSQNALDMGFVVQRSYEAVDSPDDVHRDPDGTWHIKAGAKVKIHLTLVADNRRYHVALVDPLPAGLEIINPSLAVTGTEGQTKGSQVPRYGWWWHWNWFEHQNLRDERAEVFTTLLWDGVYEYTYVARATSPGQFIVPPAKAEEMYSPEVFGRSASDAVIVE
ncbi:MAG: hypothetical protein GYA15_09290 [Leptolinea sp.]|jgi:uncharacterized protein YfaS (alpha-2-macroglobulin family)|nr:hypothetical protein [Leptolinea sp.]